MTFEARLLFNARRKTWALWFEDRQMMASPQKRVVRRWAGRHRYSIQEG